MDLLTIRAQMKDYLSAAQGRENAGCVIHAADLYENARDSISQLMCMENSPVKLKIMQRHLEKVGDRLKELKDQFHYHNVHGRLQDHIYLKEGSQNSGYMKIFGKYLTAAVREVLIYTPQLSRRNHIKNFLHFIELLVKHCPNLSYIRVNRVASDNGGDEQATMLKNVEQCLADKGIAFSHRFMDPFTEHMIIFSNGYIFKSPHGLNYFRHHDSPYTLGICDFDFRQTIKTYFVVWRTSPYVQEIPNSTFKYIPNK